MPVPKKRVSRTRRDKRRTHHKVALVGLANCPECAQPVMPHRICPSCGYYKDRFVIKPEG